MRICEIIKYDRGKSSFSSFCLTTALGYSTLLSHSLCNIMQLPSRKINFTTCKIRETKCFENQHNYTVTLYRTKSTKTKTRSDKICKPNYSNFKSSSKQK